MLKNSLTMALRNITRNKLYCSVSVLGLALGLGICLLALRFLLYELSFDNLPDKSRIYEVVLDQRFGGVTNKYAITPPHLDNEMKNYFPGIESAATFRFMEESTRQSSGLERTYSFAIADSNIFGILDLHLLHGNPRTCLTDPHSVVVTERFAKDYFGNENVFGKTVRVFQYNGWHDFTVTGLIRNLPGNSSISFAAILSSESDPMMKSTYQWSSWHTFGVYCFLKLRSAADLRLLTTQFSAFVKSTGGDPASTAMKLVPMSHIHFMTDIHTAFHTVESKYLFILSGIALLILTVSIFNFIGLSITLLTRKTKEIGIRKVAGASHGNIMAQFLVENGMLVVISLVGAICVSELLLPLFNSMLDVQLKADFLRGDMALIVLLGVIAVIDVAIGFFSTHFFASLDAQSLIRGQLMRLNPRQNLRKVLIGFQFAIAAFLICCTVVVIDQLNYIGHKDLGFDRNNFLIIDRFSSGSRIDVLKTELRRDPYITDVTEGSEFPTLGTGGTMSGGYDNGKKSVTLNMISVDEHFISALGMHLIEGRNFNPEFALDSNRVTVNPKYWAGSSINFRVYAGAVILNQEALKELTLAGAISSDSVHFVGNNWKLIGVVKDFNYSSLRNSVEPLVLQFDNSPFDYLGIKYQPGKTREVLSYVRELWKKLNPDRVLQYTFLDDDVGKMYASEDRTFAATLSGSATAILIALMGVFALSSFLVETKTKEIAVRKTLGSSISGIIRLVASDFLKLVVIANVIAWPAAYLIMRNWLENYAYRITIDLFIFPVIGAAMMVLAFVTVLSRASSAATANPVESLRYE